MTGSANARRCARLRASRSIRRSRGESGSSRASSTDCCRYCSARPASRRCHRCGSPPMTADSTISFSHFHGARSVPSNDRDACSSSSRRRRRRYARLIGSSSSGKSGSSGGDSIPVNPENRSSAGGGIAGGRPSRRRPAPGRARGIPRTAPRTAARPRIREARGTPGPTGAGRPVPRSNQPESRHARTRDRCRPT